MKVIKPTPSQAAVALKKFFALQNIDIKLSLAQEAIAVTSGYPSWNELSAHIPTRAPKSVPPEGAEGLGPEGLELWAVTCRVSGDDDDSLYLKWAVDEAEAVKAANQDLMDDSGIKAEPEGCADNDDDEDGPPTIYNISTEQIGAIHHGKFRLALRLVPDERPNSD